MLFALEQTLEQVTLKDPEPVLAEDLRLTPPTQSPLFRSVEDGTQNGGARAVKDRRSSTRGLMGEPASQAAPSFTRRCMRGLG